MVKMMCLIAWLLSLMRYWPVDYPRWEPHFKFQLKIVYPRTLRGSPPQKMGEQRARMLTRFTSWLRHLMGVMVLDEE
jgi:hypothetical protein